MVNDFDPDHSASYPGPAAASGFSSSVAGSPLRGCSDRTDRDGTGRPDRREAHHRVW